MTGVQTCALPIYLVALLVIAIAINVGMWCERAVIIIHSLQRDFLPSSWRAYTPTHVDWGIFIGTICFFLFLFLLFLRFVPFVSAFECKELRHELAHREKVSS